MLEWIRTLSGRTGAADPDELARKLALLLEGALALAMDTLDPDTPRLARDAARHLIQEALSWARTEAPASTERCPRPLHGPW
jgi:hypothetical protein